MPFRARSVGAVASPNLPARKGILASRYANPPSNQTADRWIQANESTVRSSTSRHYVDVDAPMALAGSALHRFAAAVSTREDATAADFVCLVLLHNPRTPATRHGMLAA